MKRAIAMAGAIGATIGTIGTMMLGLAGIAAAAGLTPVRALEPQQDPAEAILNSTCATCHDLTAVQPGLYTMAEWQDTIDRMIGYGAAVTDDQAQTILHYLGTDAPAEAGGDGASTEEAAMAVLNSSCTFCHDLTNVQPGFYTTSEWQDTIDRMIGYGAAISDEDRQAILRYLATDAVVEDEAAEGAFDADAAMAVLNTSCATCHDLTAVQPGLYTMAEWQATIDRMVGYGASISDENVDLILHYLGTDGGAGGASNDEAAMAILNSSCATCHDLTAVQPGLYTGAEWTEVITRMQGYGAVVSDDDANTILSYLATDWQ